MQVVLSTIGRFHTFDLARQLEKRGALKAIFTGYPTFKLRHEGLPSGRIRSFPWLHASYMYFQFRQEWLKREWSWQDRSWFDRFVAANMPDCDVFHALSGSALRSGRSAQKRGARYICDRGSSHIRFQDQILREEYLLHGLSFPGVDKRVIDAEEDEYELADAITVPSQFARDTFVAQGISKDKVFVAPYGVELAKFHRVSMPTEGQFQVLFAGTISARKGVPYLLAAYDKLLHPQKKLIMVGGVEARTEPLLAPFRYRPDIEFRGHLSQPDLMKVMSESHALVLPSVEEGLALVQAQALACGCPVIATTNTGAKDLFEDNSEGFILPIRNSDAILEKLQRLADDPDLQNTMSRKALASVSAFGGWDRYGETMADIFECLLNSRVRAA